jgi:hypothetical protein
MELKLVPRRRTTLVTCSLCLRVLGDQGWTDAEAVIRELRSYELASVPHLRPAVCDDCDDAIIDRRAQAEVAVAA